MSEVATLYTFASNNKRVMSANFSYPKKLRLRKRPEYLIMNNPDVFRTKINGFTVLARPNHGSVSRLGITVTKKIGGAVIRNRLKRRIRELFRLHQEKWPQGLDFLFIARRGAELISSSPTPEDVERLIFVLSRAQCS